MPHEPKRRHSTQRKGKRRNAIKLKLSSVSICKNCGSVVNPHTICTSCGYYKGRLIVSK